MHTLSNSLSEFLSGYFVRRLEQDPAASVRIGVVGLPDGLLREMFDRLTSGGVADLEISVGAQKRRVPILLLERTAGVDDPKVLSRGCSWDYAVTVRNSSPLLMLLVPLGSVDGMPESLANATELLGQVGSARGRAIFRSVLWSDTIKRISEVIGSTEAQVEIALSEAAKGASELPPERRNDVLWGAADTLLNSQSLQLSPDDKLVFAVGLPLIAGSGSTISDASKTLSELAKLIGAEGLGGGLEKLQGTTTAAKLLLAGELDAFAAHIRARGALSGATFQRSASFYFRPMDAQASWWNALDVSTLRKLLDDLGGGTTVSLDLSCTNGLSDSEGQFAQPSIVTSRVELAAGAPEGATPVVAFQRKLGRTAATNLPPADGFPQQCVDASPPSHDKPLRYVVAADSYESAHVDVIVLDTYECKGILRSRYADKQTLPTKDKDGVWSQSITLSRSGPTDVTILHSSNISSLSISRLEVPLWSIEREAALGSSQTRAVLEIEGGDRFEVKLKNHSGEIESSWTVSFPIDEEPRFVKSQFESLINAHQARGKRIPPRVPDTLVQRLEAQYLKDGGSWVPILACWSNQVLTIETVDWKAPYLGDTKPQVDPRPNLIPPVSLIEKREVLRKLIADKTSPVAEINFAAPDIAEAAEHYLVAYNEWLKTTGPKATWFDCVAIHASSFNKQIGISIASPEPIAILLSPLHPLRIAWHCVAQAELQKSLVAPCPAAGLLNPSNCPDSGCWQLEMGGGEVKPRTFFTLQCDHPHWSILWNSQFLGAQSHQQDVVGRLAELGLRSHGLPGGFSQSQSYDSVQEVSRLLAARSALRIGIIGEKEGSLPCALGVMDWCGDQYSEDVDRLRPDSVEIFDVRESQEPSAERIATLSNQTGERVKWFRPSSLSSAPPQDLVLLDQLGVDSVSGILGESRSAIAPGVLARIRIREDFNNAFWIRESRIGKRAKPSGHSLSDLLVDTCIDFEETCMGDSGITQLQFQPNQQAIGTQLKHAIYLAVTSRQIDPACIIRGARGQKVYLWNYELPATLGGEEENQGYYLVADPRPAMKTAIEESARLISDPPPAPDILLDEISRRGIPILKRLAAGGSQSRGELGLLLAVRLLQDAFKTGETSGLPVVKGPCVHLIVPVDPYEQPFDRIKQSLTSSLSGQRPDLLVFAMRLPDESSKLEIKITPVEVKFRQSEMSGTEIQDALKQAANFGQLLEALWVAEPRSNLWAVSARTLMGRCLDLAFRIYADKAIHKLAPESWVHIHEQVLHSVLTGTTDIVVNSSGVLLVFDNTTESEVFDKGGMICRIGSEDAAVLLTGSGTLSAPAKTACVALNLSVHGCMGESHPSVAPSPPVATQISSEEVEQSKATGEDDTPSGPEGASSSPLETVKSTLPEELEQEPEQKAPAVPLETRQKVRDVFSGFIGNEAAVLRIQNDLLRALIEKPPFLSKNYLFTGQPSTGKTEIARRMTKALQLPFVKLDGGGLRSREKLLSLIKAELKDKRLSVRDVGRQSGLPVREYPPMCIFVDEIHLVPRAVQESFLTVLESNDRTVTLEDEIAVMRRTTFLFATTRASELDKAFLSRCTEVRLREYSIDEVTEIVRRHFADQAWPEVVYKDIARFGRQVPRVALDLARELETAIKVSDEPSRSPEKHLDDVRRAHELDEQGLTLEDVSYLDLLHTEGRMGEQSISKMLGTVDPDRLTDEIEPFLRKLGLIRFGPRGREITAAGREYVRRRRKQ